MKLTFKTLVIIDFKEFIGKHTLRLAELGRGVHFVRGENEVDPELGSNGASKSTIFDALRWCLFGSTVKGLKNPDVRNWHTNEHATVKLFVLIDDEKHLIQRSTKTNGLTLDGEQASPEAIERLIGMSAATFDHTILMGQGEALFLDLSPTPKLNVLSDTLDLDRWERRSLAAKRAAEEYEAIIAKREEGLRNGQEAVRLLDEVMVDAKARVSEWESERAERDAERDKRIKELRKHEEAVDLEWGKWDLAYDGAETELRASTKRRHDLTEACDALTSKGIKTVAEMDVLEKALDPKSKLCPTCGQRLKDNDEHRERHERDHRNRLKKLLARHESEAKAVAKFEASIEKVKKEIRGFIDKSNDAQDRLTQANNRREKIKAELAVLTKNAHSDGERENPHSATVAKCRADIKEAKGLIAELEKKVRVATKRMTRARYWINGFKQIRLYLLQEALDELEAVTNAMLPSVGLDGWRIAYEIERENKSGKITSGLTVSILKPRMDKPVRWESWSGGEAQRLRLVGSIALSEMLLRRSGVECDLLVLDEPTQHLSGEGVRDTVSLLCDRGALNQILYIDHSAVESNRFASIITVTKTKAGASFNVES